MAYLMWIFSVFALLFFGFMLFINWRIFYHNNIKKDSTTSVIPLIGGISGVIGLWLLPALNLDFILMFIPLIIEWGSFPLLLATGFFLLKRKKRR
jgi:hypothetical protein